jgi:hypothetical protein
MDYQKKLVVGLHLITDTIVGVARRQFAFVDLDGNSYVAIGTDKFLLIYFEGQLYDITPLKTTLTSATLQQQMVQLFVLLHRKQIIIYLQEILYY